MSDTKPAFFRNLLAVSDDLPTGQPTASENPSREFRGLFFHYLCGLIVGVIVSFAISFVGILMTAAIISSRSHHEESDRSWLYGFFGFLALGGFLGVFAGTMCLPRGKRAFGSITLLLIGSALYVMVTLCTLCAVAGDNHGLLWIIPAAIGGTLAVTFFNWCRWPKFSS